MSQTATAELPSVRQAYDTIFDRVHSRVFFQKCAAAGIAPRTQEEAAAMLETAGKLRLIHESQPVKAAAAQDNPFFQMNAGLDAVMAQYGLAPAQPAPQEVEAGYKQAADVLFQDPEIYNAAITLKAYEAEQIRAELAAQAGR